MVVASQPFDFLLKLLIYQGFIGNGVNQRVQFLNRRSGIEPRGIGIIADNILKILDLKDLA